MSLVMSFVCAVGATMVQEWIRRFQLLTQPWYSSPRRCAHIRTSLSRDRFLEFVPAFLKSLNLLLHTSIYLFLAGLTFMPLSFNDPLTSGVVAVCFGLAVLGYGFVLLGLGFRPRALFSYLVLLTYSRDVTFFRFRCSPIPRWPTLLWSARKIEEDASTRAPTLDADAMTWLLDSLTDEEDFEQLASGIPGFYKSAEVEDPAKVLEQANTDRSPKAILAFIDRSLSSNLPEETKQRRIEVSLKAMQTDPYLLQRSFHHTLRTCSTESAIFKSVDFVLLADQHANNDDLKIRSLARSIIAIVVNRLEDCDSNERWDGIVQRSLNWSQDLFHQHREQPDSIKLRNLIQLARELNTPHLDSDTFSPEILGNLLREVCKLDVRNAAPKLQDEFCELWNELAIAVQLPDQDLALLSNMMLILSFIRVIHVSLHHQTDSQPRPSPANTYDLDTALQSPSYYTPCTASHDPTISANLSTNVSVAHDSGDA